MSALRLARGFDAAATGSSSSPAATTATPTRCSRAPARGSRRSGSRRRPGVPTGASPPTRSSARTTTSTRPRRRSRATARGSRAIIVEPVAGNMGVVPPEPGFLEALRALCDASGALLVFDEVITGFRVARGGAQERYGVTPDLTILGKIVGGGLPLAAFGGRADVMERLAPAGDVYQAGTLSGNPLATAAGLVGAAAAARPGGLRASSSARGARLEAGLAPFGRVQRVGAMLTLFMPDEPVRDFDDAQRVRHRALRRALPPPARARASTSRRRSSRRCSSRLAHGDDGDRPDGRGRWRASSADDALGRDRRRGARREPALGARRCARPASASSSRSSRRSARSASRSGSRRSTRATSPLRPAAPVRAAGRRHGAPARRLPLRARARPHRGARRASRRSPTSPR